MKTSNKKLIFIGTIEGDEEYYLKLDDEDARGWSFRGLRPATEETLRENARDREPMDYIGISRAQFNAIENYFDYDKFADDMEQDWYDGYDVVAKRENEEGETLYLGFGSGTDIFSYFKSNDITDFESYASHFDDKIGLDRETFDKVNAVVKGANDAGKSGISMSEEERKAEKEAFVSILVK